MQSGENIYGVSEMQYNALSKIKSIVFELAQTHRITNDELDDFNAAAANAFEALTEFKNHLKKAEKNRKKAIEGMEKSLARTRKLELILKMIGLTNSGIEKLCSYPFVFLRNIKNTIIKNEIVLQNDNYFELIDLKYRTIQNMIDRDKMNISAAQTMKNTYKLGNDEIKKPSKQIMEQIAEESNHIIDGLRDGKTFEELKNQIENYWYAKLSTNNTVE